VSSIASGEKFAMFSTSRAGVRLAIKVQPKTMMPLVRHASGAPGQFSGIKANTPEEFKTHDGLMEYATLPPGQDTRAFQYMMLGSSKFLYASMGRMAVMKLVHSLSASADVLALSSVEVDISAVQEGAAITVKWRGKPVFIRHRTPAEIAEAVKDDSNPTLRDPETDASRMQKPEWAIMIGICTHLGCVPINGAGAYNGWFCPCHGSHYDTSGRIRIGPAPLNLEVPEYKFLEENKIQIG
jgi:ubiquinol-cytochrome c reductase iron-sulfur subunit